MTPKPFPLGPKIERLLRRRDRPSARQIWGALLVRERKAAGESLLHTRPEERETWVRLIARKANFRPPTVRKFSDDEIVRYMCRVSPGSDLRAAQLILTYFRHNHRAMVVEFLEAAGIAHKNGVVESEHEPSREGFVVGAQRITDKFNDRDVALYLLAAGTGPAPLTPAAHTWLRKHHGLEQTSGPSDAQATSNPVATKEMGAGALDSDQKVGTTASETPDTQNDDEEDVVSAALATPPTVDDSHELVDDPAVCGTEQLDEDLEDQDVPFGTILTPLDQMLIDWAMNTTQDNDSSRDARRLSDAVGELVKLNGQRSQSYFHLGFMDGLHGDTVDTLPVGNPDCVRWFWSGALHGWAQRQCWGRIVGEYHTNQVVQALGDGIDSASTKVARSVVAALIHQEKTSEIARFVKVRVLLKEPLLYTDLLDVATARLRVNDPAMAKPILDLLMRAGRALDVRGEPIESRVVLDAHRRYAHCLRMLGEREAAKSHLQSLLQEDPDLNIHAMVHADLGVINSGFDGLEELILPDLQDKLGDFLECMDAGVNQFRRSIDTETEYSAHGHYCLGVRALGRARVLHQASDYSKAEKQLKKAEMHLQRARMRFSGNRRDYHDNLVNRANLYLGIAKTLLVDAKRFADASGMITKALLNGSRFPAYMIGPTLEALDLGNLEDLRAVSQALLKTGDDSTLERLAGCKPALHHCPDLSEKLFVRSGDDKHRSSEERARDARAALGGFLHRRDFSKASEVLDRLQVLAHNGAGVDEFIDLLGNPDRLDPAWDLEDSKIVRAHFLATQNKYNDAVHVLRGLFHQFVGKFKTGSAEALADAKGILDVFREYPISADDYKDETGQLKRMQENDSERGEPRFKGNQTPLKVRILVVGGDESQSKKEEDTRNKVEKRDPDIKLHFVQTGWKSGWMDKFREVETEMGRSDGLVLLRFMRTNFGRKVRESWSGPWRSCWSGSPGGIANTVVNVADLFRHGRSGSTPPSR